jgi:hypothetical protein
MPNGLFSDDFIPNLKGRLESDGYDSEEAHKILLTVADCIRDDDGYGAAGVQQVLDGNRHRVAV